MVIESDSVSPSHALFDRFVQAQSCKETQQNFVELCRHLEVDPKDYKHFYSKLKDRLNYWKAKELWQKIDKRGTHPDYEQGQACQQNKCLVLGAGPCGLRTAIELALLGAKVVILEKRGSFTRNNVLHLWPYTIRDLLNLGAKKFYGRFCSGSIHHISIRQLQLILLKLALILGVEVHTEVTFEDLLEPSGSTGWRAKMSPASHTAAAFEFDVFISAGGGKYVPSGFKIKDTRTKLAIGITANFVNRHTKEEAQVQEISGVARIYNQKFFQALQSEIGVDLENIVYYKDDTHYFVMTAKKASLLKKGVIKQDFSDVDQLLAPANVNQGALQKYAYDAADFSTDHMLPDLEFAKNHVGKPDVAMFDFTCMHRAENASLVRERKGKRLLIALVGDSLVEPFWPLGTGIARGFLAAFDTAWMVRSWGKGVPPLEVLAERESVYQLLSQASPENTSKNYAAYSIDPSTRYPNVNRSSIKPIQIKRLYDIEDGKAYKQTKPIIKTKPKKDSMRRLEDLLSWCQKNTSGYKHVKVKDLTESWRSGMALCALIHSFRPDLIDMSCLDEYNITGNNKLAFDLVEKELGVAPIMRPSDMTTCGKIDQLSMVAYLTQIRNALTEKHTPAERSNSLSPNTKTLSLSRARTATFFLNTLKRNSIQRRKDRLASEKGPKQQKMKEKEEEKEVKEEKPAAPVVPMSSSEAGSSELCYFCNKHLYVLERGSAEGKFFHRSCFNCYQCNSTLRQGGYTFHADTGRFYCELHSAAEEEEGDEGHRGSQNCVENKGEDKEKTQNGETVEISSPPPHLSVRRKGSYKISVDPDFEESTECLTPTEQEDQPPSDSQEPHKPSESTGAENQPNNSSPSVPVPAPRASRAPLAKPRTVHNVVPSEAEQNQEESHHDLTPESKPKPSLRKLQLSEEEKADLLSQDSDSETPASSSAASTSSSSKQHEGVEEEGYWSGGTATGRSMRDQRNRRCMRRKSEPPPSTQSQHGKLRSKFSPWNLSSPRLQQRFSVLRVAPSGQAQLDHYVSEDDNEAGADDDEDEDEEDLQREDNYLDCKGADFEISESEKRDLKRMKTLERKARMSEIQRFHKAQTIQRRLDEIEVTFKELEEKGVELERALRGEAGSDPETIDQWIDLVQEKNSLLSEESDLMVASRQLELEDKQSMLEMELRRYMEMDDSEKTSEQRQHENQILQEMLDVVDMRDSLVAFLEEKRLKEVNDELLGSSVLEAKRHSTAASQVLWD
ncbi:F-actin-monooxygenase mical1 isoform X2 [Labeo rohita]|nr:F-actin-monooxygenase mical1 isoform X2 [Labeo rohita]XP_050952592.1 F-actin-monooxygenase mical1 isoform X2 [Labeo rohita]XP_050952593.1 F-actin-monooxygenase mical1 isoform X2 [Labeo rohita]XP_050952594.1 F-actin-monooxygenase mical1 isoform X2 [Labeo rohita]XP_050952596.1 F-actin-monooxygenase mical1 isoform X2 [Labeo rohita]